jgi:hypothetical protein
VVRMVIFEVLREKYSLFKISNFHGGLGVVKGGLVGRRGQQGVVQWTGG